MMKFYRNEKKFLKTLSKIKDPAVFLGVAKILKVPCYIDKDTPRDFQDILKDTIDNYFAAAPSRQKEILKILKDANECEEIIEDGDYTKDTPKTVTNEEV